MNPPKFEDVFPEAAEKLIKIYAKKPQFKDEKKRPCYFPPSFRVDFSGVFPKTKIFKTQEELAEAIEKVFPEIISKNLGRNDKCFCGKNLKFKHCCGK